MKAVFFGDAHIDTKPERLSIVEKFLDRVCKENDAIFIMGDLFEFFYGKYGYAYPYYRSIMEKLHDLVKEGKKVYFLEGNHEFHLRGEKGGIIFTKEIDTEIDGKRIFICHGDRFAPTFLKNLLCSFPIRFIVSLLGPNLSWNTAMIFRLFLSKKQKLSNEKARRSLRFHAKRKMEEGYDVVIFAHTHISDKYEEGSKIYLNTGDFITRFDYVEYETGKGFKLNRFVGK